MKRSVSTILITLILNSAFGAGVLAQTAIPEKPADPQRSEVASDETGGVAKPQPSLTVAKSTVDPGFDVKKADKETMANYQRSKAEGKKFSTQTKILIGVGIAAAIAGIVIYAASRDKIRTF